MNALFAVFLFALVRPLLAGYAGLYFLPALLAEALHAAAPFALVALAALVLERRRSTPAAQVLATMLPWIALPVLLGRAWVEPHASVAETLGTGRALTFFSAACGTLAGFVIASLERRRAISRACSDALLFAACGWLLLGPDVYQHFDEIEVWRRAATAFAVAASFALLGVFAWLLVRRTHRALSVYTAGLIALVLVVAAAAKSPEVTHEGPSIVLVLIDTVRADAPDRLDTSGAPLMPRFHEIAGSGVRYTQAIAPAPWTLPSVVSVLSAMNPYRHQTGRMRGYVAEPGNPAAQWLGPALRAAGYQTAAFLNNPWLRSYYGIGHGYLRVERYRGNAGDGVDAALAWIDVHGSRPSFVFLHVMDPHWPYQAPQGFGEPRRSCPECDDLGTLQYKPTSPDVHAEVRRRYDAEIAYTDFELGRLWDELRARGVLDDGWLIVVSDHGEEFWDHLRFLHGHSLYDELLRVPLLIVPPLRRTDAPRGVSVDTQVRLEDVGATVADLAGVALPKIDGRSLLADSVPWGDLSTLSTVPPLAADDVQKLRPVVAGFLQLEGRRDWAVRAAGMKFLRTAEAPLALVFDLGADPHETRTVTPPRPLATLFLSTLPDKLGFPVERKELRAPAAPASGATRPGGALERELRALGYVDSQP